MPTQQDIMNNVPPSRPPERVAFNGPDTRFGFQGVPSNKQMAVPPPVTPQAPGTSLVPAGPLNSVVADPWTGQLAGRGMGAGLRAAARPAIQAVSDAAPALNALGAMDYNDAAMQRNVPRLADQQNPTGALAQETALQFMRSPAMGMRALQIATGMGGQQPASQQQPTTRLDIPAGAESTVRSPLAEPAPQYMRLDQPREPIAQPAAQSAQPGWGRPVDINDVQGGEGVMRNDTGTYGYRQMENGNLVKFDGQGNQVGTLGNVGRGQQAGGMRLTSYGAMTPVDNPLAYETERRMAEKTAAAEEAKLARLEELAMTGGGGDGTFEGMGEQKRIRRGAQAALGERMGMQRAQLGADTQQATQQAQNNVTMRGQDIQGRIAEATNQVANDKLQQDAYTEARKLGNTIDYQKSELGLKGRETALKEQRAKQHTDAVIGRAQQMRMDSRYDHLSDEAVAALAEQSMASRIPPELMATVTGL